MQLSPGSIVRPVVSVAGLDARLLYRVAHVVQTPFYSLAWLDRADDPTLFHLVENAHTVLELAQTRAINPAAASFN